MEETCPLPVPLAMMLGSENFTFKIFRPSGDTNSTTELRDTKIW